MCMELALWINGGLSPQAGVAAATAATSASLLLGVLPQLPPPAAQAITNEQLLYLEAWRAVDRAYVDKTFNGNSWFRVGGAIDPHPLCQCQCTARRAPTRDDAYMHVAGCRFVQPVQAMMHFVFNAYAHPLP